MPNQKDKHVTEITILEELFLDQLAFKLQAAMSLQPLPKDVTRAIDSFGKDLERLTHENMELLNKHL